ncbi:LAGLIDADG family homing endonuclease, partial [Staphylococcus capitis]|uniref:LAGLIDADG family homing endonuclease n=1 Tax=Staphylococcus capitis TaxID=29388 RepID=UPI001379192B
MDDGSKAGSKEDGDEKAVNIKPTAMLHMNRYDKKYVEYFSQMLLFKFGIKNIIRESKVDKEGKQTHIIYITAEG